MTSQIFSALNLDIKNSFSEFHWMQKSIEFHLLSYRILQISSHYSTNKKSVFCFFLVCDVDTRVRTDCTRDDGTCPDTCCKDDTCCQDDTCTNCNNCYEKKW